MALLTVVDDETALAEHAAGRIADVLAEAVRVRGSASWCLTGGRTPKRTYERLASDAWRERVDWSRVHLYWTDERHVPPDHPDSNYGMARAALIVHAPILPAHVHRIRGELPPDEAARTYERELPDRFDLVLLGVGEDSHIASLFPGSPLLAERRRRAADVWVPHLNAYRITLTAPALLGSDRLLVLVAGAAKAAAVGAALHAPSDVTRHPVHLLRDAGDRVEWVIDRAAARDVAERRE